MSPYNKLCINCGSLTCLGCWLQHGGVTVKVSFYSISLRTLLLWSHEMFYIVYEHWPETHEFITQTVALWNRWFRLSCYYNTLWNTCPVNTHLSPILQCVGPCNLFGSVWSMFLYNSIKCMENYFIINRVSLKLDWVVFVKCI